MSVRRFLAFREAALHRRNPGSLDNAEDLQVRKRRCSQGLPQFGAREIPYQARECGQRNGKSRKGKQKTKAISKKEYIITTHHNTTQSRVEYRR
jgi:hypothetical protein